VVILQFVNVTQVALGKIMSDLNSVLIEGIVISQTVSDGNVCFSILHNNGTEEGFVYAYFPIDRYEIKAKDIVRLVGRVGMNGDKFIIKVDNLEHRGKSSISFLKRGLDRVLEDES
jgi:hypothetical protein